MYVVCYMYVVDVYVVSSADVQTWHQGLVIDHMLSSAQTCT